MARNASLLSLLLLAVNKSRADDNAPPSSMTLMFPNGLHDVFDFENGGLNSVPTADYTLAKWSYGMVPKVCHDAAVNDKRCAVDKFDVYDITYSDCGQPWTVCRCQDSPMPVKNIAEQLGRLPVAVRTWVRFTQFYNDNPSAFTDGSDITFFGDFSENQSVFVHESSHNLDRWVAGEDGDWYSFTNDWRNFVGTDTCVPDSYAMSTYTEDFAQIGVLVAYDANVAPFRNLDGANTGCLDQQFKKASKAVTSTWKYNAKDTCGQRIDEDNSPPVCVNDAAQAAGQCNGKSYENGAKLRTRDVDYPHVRSVSNRITPENQVHVDAMLAEMKDHHHFNTTTNSGVHHPSKRIVKVGNKISPENQGHVDAMLENMRNNGYPSKTKRFTA